MYALYERVLWNYDIIELYLGITNQLMNIQKIGGKRE
jgi:hypothetical protein